MGSVSGFFPQQRYIHARVERLIQDRDEVEHQLQAGIEPVAAERIAPLLVEAWKDRGDSAAAQRVLEALRCAIYGKISDDVGDQSDHYFI